MAEFARICERACTPNSLSGLELAGRLEELAVGLAQASEQLQASSYDPSQTMPCVVGIQGEASAMRMFARWLRVYDVVTARSLSPFRDFLGDMEAFCTNVASSPDTKADLAEVTADALLMIRGERPATVVDDFAWVDAWAQAGRARKTWGLFGTEEKLDSSIRFLAPVWVAEVGYSASTGAVFKEGVESRTLALVDACAPEPARVQFLDSTHAALAQALSHTGTLPSASVALPRSTAGAAGAVIAQAAKGRSNMLNARIQVRGLAWLPAAAAAFSSEKGMRHALTCMNGSVPVDDAAIQQLEVARRLAERFG
jgi:hypothetical protein